ncbi:ABC transporter ATP-binding protein [Mycetocola sp. JXN-3]|uniref:ABC transporter ATP-binding protein n=1 Tax=Mycetocola sp. JXN-3 TaxID=2116510 RepID=UPI0021039237|nr:energy-coupling factor transporter ATPase [Mycetocola sp. JXN-3]
MSITHEGGARPGPDGASLELVPGEVLLVLGPSGSGKSTLALALNGLVPHAIPATLTGSVRVAGTETVGASVATLSETVAMVFQDPDSQMITGSVLDEVCFGPENLGLPVAEVLERAETALREVDLWERRTENPDRLSGGGRQRLAIACALAMRSPVLVLDEPTANLDPAGIEEVYRVLARVVARQDRSIVLIEHNLDPAMDLVNRVLVLDGLGRTAFLGDAHSILRTHAAELLELGVWLPVSLMAALHLHEAGIVLDPLPLTPRELTAALNVLDLPVLVDPPPPTPGIWDTPQLEVTGLSLKRGRRLVLRDINLSLDAGSFLAVIGTNGAGKTTLVQAIAGVIQPPRGTVSLGGLDPARLDVRTLTTRIGFVFQNPENQFVTYTVANELAHGLRLRGIDQAIIDARVDDLLERFALTEARDQHPFLLSGGQKRRLSVGTALVAGASMLALDEPTFGQDRARAGELLALLHELNAAGTTIIVVSHDLQLVSDFATHVAVMKDGELVRIGTRDEILADEDLLHEAGLRMPPLIRAMRGLTAHPSWRTVTRLAELPGGGGLR